MPHPIIEIRLALVSDREALGRVMRNASFAVASGEVLRRLREEAEHIEVDTALLRRGQVVVATVEREPAGFASFLIEGSNEAELDGMFVEPGYWRRGLGTRLFQAVERELVDRQATGVRVVAGETAVDFYKSVGFSVVGEEKTSFGPVVPVMSKTFR